MRRLACAFAVVSLALMGCSSSLCEDYKDAQEELDEKARPCRDGAPSVEEPFDVQRCESEFSQCSDSDQEAIEEYIDCLGEVDKCAKGYEQDYAEAYLGCAITAAGKLSNACASMLAQEIRRTAAVRSRR